MAADVKPSMLERNLEAISVDVLLAVAGTAAYMSILANMTPSEASCSARAAMYDALTHRAAMAPSTAAGRSAPACGDRLRSFRMDTTDFECFEGVRCDGQVDLRTTECEEPEVEHFDVHASSDGVASRADPRMGACAGGSSSELFSLSAALRVEAFDGNLEARLNGQAEYVKSHRLEQFEPFQLQLTLLEANMQTIRADLIENPRTYSEDVQSAEARLHTAAWNLETHLWKQVESIERKAALVESDVQSIREQLAVNSHSAELRLEAVAGNFQTRLIEQAESFKTHLLEQFEPFKLQTTLFEANMQSMQGEMAENLRTSSQDVQSAEARLHTVACNLETRFWKQVESIERKAALVKSDVQSIRQQLAEKSRMDAETVKLAAMKVEIPIPELVEPFVSGPMTVFIGSMPATGIDDRDKCGAELRSEELPRPPERSRTGPPKTARGKSGGQRAVKSILGKDGAGHLHTTVQSVLGTDGWPSVALVTLSATAESAAWPSECPETILAPPGSATRPAATPASSGTTAGCGNWQCGGTGNTLFGPCLLCNAGQQNLNDEFDYKFGTMLLLMPQCGVFYCARERRKEDAGIAKSLIPLDMSWLRMTREVMPISSGSAGVAEVSYAFGNDSYVKRFTYARWSSKLSTIARRQNRIILRAAQCDRDGPMLAPDIFNGQDIGRWPHDVLKAEYNHRLARSNSARMNGRHYAMGCHHFKLIDPALHHYVDIWIDVDSVGRCADRQSVVMIRNLMVIDSKADRQSAMYQDEWDRHTHLLGALNHITFHNTVLNR